ncbi:MAG TPA: hypothetical protein VHS99_18140 [Chloroflexota bacterium]|nr:hypothetical protein [Chloroflexota bacterium]
MMLGLTLWLVLFVLAALLLVFGLLMLMLAPVLASRLAATSSRPRLERRASGPDRMRSVINAQLGERRKQTTLATTLTRSGLALGGVAVVCLIGGIVALVAGY